MQEERDTKDGGVSSWSHLKLLLWKNFIQMKRSPIATAVELFSPVVVIMVLAILRSANPSVPKPTDYKQAVPLPSAGLIPMLQYFCPEVSSDSQGFPDYPYESITKFLEFLSTTVSSNDEYMDLQSIQVLLSSFSDMVEQDGVDYSDAMFVEYEDSFLDMGAGPSVDIMLSDPRVDPILRIVQSSGKIQSQLPWLHQLSEQLESASQNDPVCSRHFSTGNETQNKTSACLQAKEYISLDASGKYKFPREPTVMLVNVWNSLQSVLCGVNQTLNESIFDRPLWIKELGFTDLQQAKFTQVATLLFKGSPKILYTPNTTEVNLVMAKATESMQTLFELTQSSKALYNISSQVIDLLAKEKIQEFYQLLQQSQNNTLKSPGMGTTEADLPVILPDISSLQQMAESFQRVTCLWNSVMSDVDMNFFVPVADEKNMAIYINDADKKSNVTVLAGVVFETNQNGELPSHVTYKLKLNRTYAPDILATQTKIWSQAPPYESKPVLDELFPWLQDIIDRAIIQSKTGKPVVEPGGYIREFPWPCHVADEFMERGGPPLTVVLPMFWCFYIISFTHTVVSEKEQRLKEMMKIMGLSNFIYWLSWFLSSLAQMCFSVTLLVVTLKYGKLFTYVSPTVLWVFNMVFSISVILYSLLMSACFSKAKLGAASAGFVYLFMFVPFYYIQNLDILYSYVLTPTIKALTCLLPPSAYGLGLRYILFYDHQAIGLQWSNLNTPWPVFYRDITVAQVIFIIVITCIVYLVLTWYIEETHPGSFGIPQPWYFPVTKSYWFNSHHQSTHHDARSRRRFQPCMQSEFRLMDKYTLPGNLVEDKPIGHSLGVHIKNLTKVYKNGRVVAIDGLNLRLYTGQITALLGRNGAGKTTVMSILTGFIPPTKGTVMVYGRDIRTEMIQIRQSLGMSPQYDALFNKLTVQEHLWFYSRLKGVCMANFQAENKKLLTDIGLVHRRHNTIKSLSGGMKRKLSVAIAFTGGSKTVILDEPTAGVDPHARRAIWDLLLKYRKGRTILLSTHHMDEASLLGDRIAIISNGRLKFCGSPHHLKTNLGDGYKLIVVKDANKNITSTGTMTVEEKIAPSSRITNFIHEYFPSARLTSENENEMQYLIPMRNIQKSSFIDLFGAESRKDELGISSYAMTEATLEQIFLKVTRDQNDGLSACVPTSTGFVEDGEVVCPQQSIQELIPGNLDQTLPDMTKSGMATHQNGVNRHSQEQWKDTNSKKDISGASRLLWILVGLYIKRWHYVKRDIKTVIAQIIVPMLLIVLAAGMTKIYEQSDQIKSLTLLPSMYMAKPVYVPYSNEAVMLPENVSEVETGIVRASDLIRTLFYPAGLGTTCLQVLNTTADVKKNSWFRPAGFTSCLLLSIKVNHSQSYNISESPTMFEKEYYNNAHPQYNVNLTTSLPDFTVASSTDTEDDTAEETCQCNADSTDVLCSGTPPSNMPAYKVTSGEILQDMSGNNITKYFMESRHEHRQNRLGALSFGNIRTFVPEDFVTKLNASSPFRKLASRHAVVAWFNTLSTQSDGVFVNVVNNAIFRANVDATMAGRPSDYGITVVNEPIMTDAALLERFVIGGMYLKIAIVTLAAMTSVSSSIVIFLVAERASKAKHLHYISGVSPLVYWLSNYSWDLLNHLIPIAGVVAIFLAFEVPVYSTAENTIALVVIFVMYSLATIPMMYLVTYMVNVPSAAFMVAFFVSDLVSYFPTIVTLYMQYFAPVEAVQSLMDSMDKLFMLIPGYCLGYGMIELAFCDVSNAFYREIGQFDRVQSPFEWHLLTHRLVVMGIEAVILFSSIILYEYGFFTRFFRRNRENLSEMVEFTEMEDTDVAKERRRVIAGATEDVVRLVNLTKVYKKKKTSKKCVAVDRLCLGVPQGECFGLLGINGAGKTTLFEMLTGDRTVTHGDAFVNGKSISRNLREVYEDIGYCPQFDGLYNQLTGREHLMLYARLCGVQSASREQVVESMLEKMNLLQYADKQTGTYSGGNKRKLSTAISLIGNPKVLLMDEPTTGMDPKSKRFLWQIINNVAKSGTSVVFTSHSMEECESLCSRLAIMVSGRFKCIGNIQHLKTRFGDGYTITLVLNKSQPRLQQVQAFFRQAFPESVLKDSHVNMVQFELKSISLVEMFSKLEEMKIILNIEDYYVRQTTLDDIFINFAKQSDLTASESESGESVDEECNTTTTPEQENLLESDIPV